MFCSQLYSYCKTPSRYIYFLIVMSLCLACRSFLDVKEKYVEKLFWLYEFYTNKYNK